MLIAYLFGISREMDAYYIAFGAVGFAMGLAVQVEIIRNTGKDAFLCLGMLGGGFLYGAADAAFFVSLR